MKARKDQRHRGEQQASRFDIKAFVSGAEGETAAERKADGRRGGGGARDSSGADPFPGLDDH